MVLLAVIGYLTAQGRNVFEESGQSSVVRVRVELVRGMRDTSWSRTALEEPHVAVTSCVDRGRAPPAFHCARGEGRSLRSSWVARSFANVPSGSTRDGDFGKATNPEVPAEPALVCGGGPFGAPALEVPPKPVSLPAEPVRAAAAGAA